MEKLSDYESGELIDVLDMLEAEYYEEWKHLNGGYSEAECFDCNEDTVYIEVRHGQQDMGSGHSVDHTDELEISREILRDHGMDIKTKTAYVS